MRIFSNAEQMVREVERDLFEMGTRYQSKTVQDKYVKDDPDYQTIELVGYSYMLTDFDNDHIENVALYSGYLNLKTDWLIEEMAERIHGPHESYWENPGAAWERNEELWRPFLRNGCFSYSYTERWRQQLP